MLWRVVDLKSQRSNAPIVMRSSPLFGKRTLQRLPCISQNLTIFIFGTFKALDASTEVVNPVDRYVDVQYWATEKKSVYKTP